MQTALALKNMPVQLFRAGVWKPRTRPGSFEGVGAEALGWLKEVKETVGLLVAVEVAETAHIELALKYGVDVLWVGARGISRHRGGGTGTVRRDRRRSGDRRRFGCDP